MFTTYFNFFSTISMFINFILKLVDFLYLFVYFFSILLTKFSVLFLKIASFALLKKEHFERYELRDNDNVENNERINEIEINEIVQEVGRKRNCNKKYTLIETFQSKEAAVARMNLPIDGILYKYRYNLIFF